MGCATSKIDDLPAVVLCRDRLTFLDAALRHRYELAEAHVAYLDSLKSVGDSLNHFFAGGGDGSASGDSPVLNLPPQRKAVSAEEASEELDSGHLSHSNSGSHLHFHSDSDEESGSDSPLHRTHSPSPARVVHHPEGIYQIPEIQEGFGSYSGGGYMHMNYMKKGVTPSVSYEQRPISAETVHIGDSSYYNSFYSSNQNPSSYSYGNNGLSYMGYGGDGGGMGFFESSAPPPYGFPPPRSDVASSSTTKSPPPPPPPPPPSAGSAWDFLNPFESIENNYPPYTPSRDSREVREEEGIPDLEDEDYQQEVVKEVHGDQKLVEDGHSGGSSVGGGKEYAKGVVEDEDVGVSNGEALFRARPSGAAAEEATPVEYEVHMVDKKVVGDAERGQQSGRPRNASEAVKEIQVQFQRASQSGSELSKMLEVGKLPYRRKHVSSKMFNAITPSLPSTSRDSEATILDPNEEVGLRSRSLSATLHKLYLWEKKLFEEVKVEEKMRVVHDRKVRKLKHLDERGAEPHKADATHTLVRTLSTKIRIAIQIVDRISVKINKLRDDELWPQLNELIQGLSRMWKAMLECHHYQSQVVEGAKGLDAVAFPNNPTDDHLLATLQLEHELINWTFRFSDWVGAQKGCVRALNGWLLKCLLVEPEETPDGVAPFSPGRAGAPPIFVICNHWSQSLDRISEKEVLHSMRIFAMIVLHYWDRDKGEMRQRMMVDKDTERKVKNLEREDVKIQKEMQALDKKMIMASGDASDLSLSGHVVYQSDTSSKIRLHSALRNVFEAMDRYAAETVKAYEEILQRIEEVVQQQSSVS